MRMILLLTVAFVFRNKWHRNGKDIMMYGYWEISNEKEITRRSGTAVRDDDERGASEKETFEREKRLEKKIEERE